MKQPLEIIVTLVDGKLSHITLIISRKPYREEIIAATSKPVNGKWKSNTTINLVRTKLERK